MNQSTNTKTLKSSRRVVGTRSSTLQALRSLQPKRALTWTESTAIAARQANRLRSLTDNYDRLAFDVQIIADQPRF